MYQLVSAWRTPVRGSVMSLEQRMVDCICSGRPFTADHVTDEGNETIAGDHAPNGRQNGIGSLFRLHSVEGRIAPTGRVVRSRAPHRKGGMIREWQATEKGRRWALGKTALM